MVGYVEASAEISNLVHLDLLDKSVLSTTVKISKEFLAKNPKIDRTDLIISLLADSHPINELKANQTPRQIVIGGRGGRPVSLELPGQSITAYSKPFPEDHRFMAKNDFEGTITALDRGIRTILPIALINDQSGAVLYTKYDQRFNPLFLQELNFRMRDQSVYSPKQFLTDYLAAIARMHDQGIANGDLHHGNIGLFSRGPSRTPAIGIMDFETASVLDSIKLKIKGQQFSRDNSDNLDFEEFESKAIEDVIKFTYVLAMRRFPIQGQELVDLAANEYQLSRRMATYPLEDTFDSQLRQGLSSQLGR